MKLFLMDENFNKYENSIYSVSTLPLQLTSSVKSQKNLLFSGFLILVIPSFDHFYHLFSPHWSFIQHIFIKHLPCARHVSGTRDVLVNKEDKVLDPV